MKRMVLVTERPEGPKSRRTYEDGSKGQGGWSWSEMGKGKREGVEREQDVSRLLILKLKVGL